MTLRPFFFLTGNKKNDVIVFRKRSGDYPTSPCTIVFLVPLTDEESASPSANSLVSTAISPSMTSASTVGQQHSFVQRPAFPQGSSPQHTFNGGTAMSSAGSVAPVTPIVSASQLSPISPTLPAQMSQPYTADVCQYGPIYNAYNYAAAAGKMRTSSPYGRTGSAASVYQPPYHHPHQNPFPNAPFYSRTVQNPYDYSPR